MVVGHEAYTASLIVCSSYSHMYSTSGVVIKISVNQLYFSEPTISLGPHSSHTTTHPKTLLQASDKLLLPNRMSEPLSPGVYVAIIASGVVVLGMMFWVIRSELCCGRRKETSVY